MKKITFVFILAGSILLSSCDVLLSVLNQAASVANLTNCDFSLKNVSNVSVAGVNVKNLTQGNLTATDVVKLVAAYQSKKVPLAMDVNVDIKNPTTTEAAMTALDWILAIDGKDMANGVNSRSYTIKPSTTTTVPLGVNTDLGQLFSKEGLESLKNFASSFTNEGISSKVGLRVKPSMNVGTQTIAFPNYIKLEKKTGTNTTTTNNNSGSHTLTPAGSLR
jgi:LEA14-like dessication related protein